MRARGVAAGRLTLPGGAVVEVSFAPEIPSFHGDAPTPGGWKSPSRLDDPFALDPRDPEPAQS